MPNIKKTKNKHIEEQQQTCKSHKSSASSSSAQKRDGKLLKRQCDGL
jgi:hypothetical protein